MAQKQLILPGDIVKKSNALARARWSAESVWEPRLVALLASKVRHDDTDFQVYEVPVSEILQSTGGRDYREIEAVVDKVMSRVLTIRDDNGWTKYNVFSRCRYRRKEGILELGFHPDLRPHYLNLQKQFAQYNLLEYLMLPSIYSQRIFEILKSWADKPEVVLSLAELHEMLDTPESLKKDFRNFRLRVLEKAHADIHKSTSLAFEWEPVKKGRAVESVRFYFGGKRFALKDAKAKEKRQKDSTAANRTFHEAIQCAKEKYLTAGTCAKPDNKRKICAFCREHNLFEDVARHQKAKAEGKIPSPPPVK